MRRASNDESNSIQLGVYSRRATELSPRGPGALSNALSHVPLLSVISKNGASAFKGMLRMNHYAHVLLTAVYCERRISYINHPLPLKF